MSGSLEQPGNLKPTYGRDMESVWREIRKLWVGVNNRSRGAVDDVPFVLAGQLYASTSPRYYRRVPSVLQRVLASVDVPGTTPTAIGLYRNASVAATVTLGAGVSKTQVALSLPFDPDTDYLRVGVLTPGAGAKDLDVQCRFRSEA